MKDYTVLAIKEAANTIHNVIVHTPQITCEALTYVGSETLGDERRELIMRAFKDVEIAPYITLAEYMYDMTRELGAMEMMAPEEMRKVILRRALTVQFMSTQTAAREMGVEKA